MALKGHKAHSGHGHFGHFHVGAPVCLLQDVEELDALPQPEGRRVNSSVNCLPFPVVSAGGQRFRCRRKLSKGGGPHQMQLM